MGSNDPRGRTSDDFSVRPSKRESRGQEYEYARKIRFNEEFKLHYEMEKARHAVRIRMTLLLVIFSLVGLGFTIQTILKKEQTVSKNNSEYISTLEARISQLNDDYSKSEKKLIEIQNARTQALRQLETTTQEKNKEINRWKKEYCELVSYTSNKCADIRPPSEEQE